MRPGPHSKRGRGRSGGGNRRNNVPARHQTFDSHGPDVRLRGNPQQLHEKYTTLARDAFSSGDRVVGESCLQHAEHYYRIMNADREEQERRQARPNGRDNAQTESEDNAEQRDGEDRGGEGQAAQDRREGGNAPRDESQDASQAAEPAPRRGRRNGAENRNSGDAETPAPAQERAAQDKSAQEKAQIELIGEADAAQPPLVEAEAPPKPRRGRPRRTKPATEQTAAE